MARRRKTRLACLLAVFLLAVAPRAAGKAGSSVSCVIERAICLPAAGCQGLTRYCAQAHKAASVV